MFLDINQLFDSIRSIPVEFKHAALMNAAGVKFYDADWRFVSEPSVGLIGIGGLAIQDLDGDFCLNGNIIDLNSIKNDLLILPGASAAMSYMNSSNKSLTSLAKVVIQKFKHLSILHTVYLNIAIFGISSAVEHEFDCQRDLVHLSRLTVARTNAQSRPSFVVLNQNHLPVMKEIVKFVDQKIMTLPDANDLESTNNLYPALKAQSLILSGSVKNIMKLCEQVTDDGKEGEYRRALKMIDSVRQLIA